MITLNESPPDRAASAGDGQSEPAKDGLPNFLAIARQAETNHQTQFSYRSGAWQRSYRAYRNEHFARSKYLTPEYASRSKLFVPKTRSAIRRKQTAAAAALFSNDDVVTIRPEREDDEHQEASALALHELVNYRLDRTSPRGGIPFFQITMGAHQDAQLTGICCSKQYWEYEEREVDRKPVMGPMKHPDTGEAFLHPTGEPVMAESGKTEPVMKVVKDRPMIKPIPPENVIIDPAAHWFDPAQSAGYLTLRFPMLLTDVREMIQNPDRDPKSRTKWKDVSDDKLKSAVAAYDAKGVRLAREGKGQDRLDRQAQQITDFTVCWVHENFIRYRGDDYVFWSVGTALYLSEVAKTEEIYPEFNGLRPVVYGLGAIESHNIWPMAPAESWQPLQQETNDLRNLRLDAVKQSVLPFATVKAGKQVDVSILTRLAPGAHVYVKDHDDIQFREMPDGAANASAESDHLNVDFDDLTGSFGASSVQTDQHRTETVGGMRILSGDANSLNEFDLRVFVETWVEPVIRQIVHLEQYYENDETVLAVAGDRAQLQQKFGIDKITEDMLTADVTVKVNVGIGATDPMMRLQKLDAGLSMIAKAGPYMKGMVRLKAQEFIKEVMGATGHKSGLRFFEIDEQQPSLTQMQMQMKMQLEQMKEEIRYKISVERGHSLRDVERMRGAVMIIDTIINAKFAGDQLRQEGSQDAMKMIADYFMRSESIPVGDPPSDQGGMGGMPGGPQGGPGAPPGSGGPQGGGGTPPMPPGGPGGAPGGGPDPSALLSSILGH